MKTLMLLLFAVSISHAQFGYRSNEQIPKTEEPQYLLVYLNSEQVNHSSGDSFILEKDWVTHSEIFPTFEALIKWLNSPNYFYLYDDGKKRDTKIEANQLIGIWDLQTAKKVSLKRKTEHKVVPHHVEIKKEEWDNSWWEKE